MPESVPCDHPMHLSHLPAVTTDSPFTTKCTSARPLGDPIYANTCFPVATFHPCNLPVSDVASTKLLSPP